MRQAEMLREAILLAKSQGVRISRGAIFDWTGPGLISCDATGAVLLKAGAAKAGFPAGWMKNLCSILDVDSFWLWRFWMGFNVNFQVLVQIDKKDKAGDIRTRFKKDDVSELGIQLAKEFV